MIKLFIRFTNFGSPSASAKTGKIDRYAFPITFSEILRFAAFTFHTSFELSFLDGFFLIRFKMLYLYDSTIYPAVKPPRRHAFLVFVSVFCLLFFATRCISHHMVSLVPIMQTRDHLARLRRAQVHLHFRNSTPRVIMESNKHITGT